MPDRDESERRVEEILRELRVRDTAGGPWGPGPVPPVPPEVHERLGRTASPAVASVEERPLRGAKSADLIDQLRRIEKTIYLTDDRMDLFEVGPAQRDAVLRDADAVVSLFREEGVTDNGDGTSTLTTTPCRARFNLCPLERFGAQPVGSFGSGFVVAADLIATAGNSVRPDDLAGVRFVFGFRMLDRDTARTVVPNREIYKAAAVVGREVAQGSDWAVVRVDRAIAGHGPLPVRRSGKVADGQSVYIIGHPLGLPAKYAPGANVRDNAPAPFFLANLDAYGGNSGSPVFNFQTREVEGVLAVGDVDLVVHCS